MRAHVEMLEFKVGERVSFQPEGRPPVFGILTRYNKKTVTVISDDGQQWNVSPGYLRKVERFEDPDSRNSNVIRLTRK
jgi:hypothetical protein